MSTVKKYIFVFACIVCSAKAWGQAAPSPYSTFGIGEPYGSGLVHNQGNGGMGVSQPQYWYLNNQNPALLVYNTLTIFGAGILAERKTVSGDTTNEESTGGNMNYLVTAFPVKPGKWTTSLGLMPYTSVNYSFSYVADVIGSPDKVSVEEEGSGGPTQLYWSNGVRLNEDFAVGLKASYVFGAVVNRYKGRLINVGTPTNYYAVVEDKTYIKDFTFGLGGSFSKDSIGRKNYTLSIGAVYNLKADLKTRSSVQLFRETSLGDKIEGTSLDTVRGSISVPQSLVLGASFAKGTFWSVGTEFSYQDWSSFKSLSQDDEGLGKAWRMVVGGEITPDPVAVESYFKRITYRTGVSYEQYPFLTNGKEVKDFGINFGLSLPAGRSSLDLAVKVGKRGDKKVNVLEESYFKVYFGITFNDQWFVKRKFD
ncbi:MAG: hypothetical protein JNM57_17355 [Cyclobacteriaceae bacterium]|nr:hypothetical protein [Cyclobacteriaceae bacterium]